MSQRILLCKSKLKIFKFQLIAHIHAKGEQCDGDLGNYACLIVFDKGIVSPDINDGTDHVNLLYRMKLVNARLSYSGRP